MRPPNEVTVGILVSLLACGACHREADATDGLTTIGQGCRSVECANIVLRLSPTSVGRRYGVGTSTVPTIGIDLSGAPDTSRTRVRIEPCASILPFDPGAMVDAGTADAGSSASACAGKNGRGPAGGHGRNGFSASAGAERTFASGHSFWASGPDALKFVSEPYDGDDDDGWDNRGWETTAECQISLNSCFRVVANAYGRGGSATGHAEATVRRGDFKITGNTKLPSDLLLPDAGAPVAQIEAQVGGHLMETRADPQGRFEFDNVPAGTLLRVRATLLVADDQPRLKADTSPLVVLSATNPSANVDLTLAHTEFAIDKFEPDDTPADVAGRTALPLAVAQSHNLPTREDIDLIPVDFVAGTLYRVSLVPSGPRPADLQLALLDSTGKTVLAHANDTASDYQERPSIIWAAPSTGRVLARVSRSDDETIDAPYSITVETATGTH